LIEAVKSCFRLNPKTAPFSLAFFLKSHWTKGA